MKYKLVLMTSLVALSSAVSAQGTAGTSAAPSAGKVVSAEPQYTRSMEQLQQSAQRLRESIQALAQKAPGRDRDQALSSAHEALLTTQRAMLTLPPELRSTGTVSTGEYDAAVRKLMQSADSLRNSIQEMAQQPAGERRNQAIATANRALFDTQMAMVHAYQPKSGAAQTMGAAKGNETVNAKPAVQELREDSRAVSKAAHQGAVEARKEIQVGPGGSNAAEGAKTR